jgi:hypothetical protein
MKELGFPFSIKPAAGSLELQHGYMPMLLRREETGVEFDVYDDPAALAEFADEGIDPSLDRMASFRWAGDMQEMLAGMCCAAALAKLTDGIVFDAEEGKLRSVDEAITFARGHLQAVDKPEEARRPGTRPADIKRYLKPLLKLRPDLALVGRHLLIRPVRHPCAAPSSIAPATGIHSPCTASPVPSTNPQDMSDKRMRFIAAGGRSMSRISNRCCWTHWPKTFSQTLGRSRPCRRSKE